MALTDKQTHFVGLRLRGRPVVQDLFALKVDFASAINRVDQAYLFYIMEQVAIPGAVIVVVKGIYRVFRKRHGMCPDFSVRYCSHPHFEGNHPRRQSICLPLHNFP